MDFNAALPYVMPIVGLFGMISGIWYRVESKINAGVADAKAAGVVAHQRAEEAERALNAFRLEVVREYASWDTVKAIESRLSERMDNLSEQVMKMPDQIAERMFNMIKLSQK
jgi:hypothetical protein